MKNSAIGTRIYHEKTTCNKSCSWNKFQKISFHASGLMERSLIFEQSQLTLDNTKCGKTKLSLFWNCNCKKFHLTFKCANIFWDVI